MYTWGQLKTDLRKRLFPQGEAENLVAAHDAKFIDAYIDIQTWAECYQQDNTDVRRQCETYYQCGVTVLDAPRGIIRKVSVIDKVNPETHLEDADSDADWCSEVIYTEIDFQNIRNYIDRSRRCGRLLPSGAFFGLPYWGCRPKVPVPTDEGLPAALPMLDLGFHYPQTSTDRNYGRAGIGIWAKARGRVYIAPWIQSTETVVMEWDGIKRTWKDADPIDEDPLLAVAIEEYVRWKHFSTYEIDEARASAAGNEYGIKLAMLIHQCREETRQRGRSTSHARQASTMGGQTTALFYNDEQSVSATCPDTQTGNPSSVTIPSGTVGSNISVADANQRALAMAQQQAKEQLDCTDKPVTYWNTAQTAIAMCDTEDGAPAPTGNPITVTVPADSYSSQISQADADSQAYAAALSQARSQRQCTYGNKEQSYTASCPNGETGPTVTITIAAGTYHSTLSQSDADAQALAAATSQAKQQVTAGCTVDTGTFGNTTQTCYGSAVARCPNGIGGYVNGSANVTVTVPANAFYDYDQAAANSVAIAQGTAFANQVAQSRAASHQCGNHSTIYPNP